MPVPVIGGVREGLGGFTEIKERDAEDDCRVM
jgi:hypothetical protein